MALRAQSLDSRLATTVRTVGKPLAKPLATVPARLLLTNFAAALGVIIPLGALLPGLTAALATALLDLCATLVALPALDALSPLLAPVRSLSTPLLAVIRALSLLLTVIRPLSPLLAVIRALSALFPAIGALLCTLPTLAPLRARIAASLAILGLRAISAIASVAGL